MRQSMPYGEMPSKQAFEAAFAEECASGGFGFANDNRVGTRIMSCSDLWEELQSAWYEWSCTGAYAPGDWCSAVLYSLGFEWI